MAVPAIVAAGDRRASKAVYGESKVYLEIEGVPLVARVVSVLQRVPEVSEVWVVGNARRLETVLGREEFQRQLTKPLHIVPQFRNLYENLWETYRRALPDAPPQGRDPGPADADRPALFLSADIPFATPHEISAFVRRSLEAGCDFAAGMVPEQAMEAFYPKTPGEPGIRMAYFNLAEGRFRGSNLFLVKPWRLGNRHYVEEMYEHRYQKQWGKIAGLAWRLLRSEDGGLRVLFYFLLIQIAGIANRNGWKRLADRVRAHVPVARAEALTGTLLRTSFRMIFTEVGGCAVDVDNEPDYDAARARFREWHEAQLARGEALYGALPAEAGRREPS